MRNILVVSALFPPYRFLYRDGTFFGIRISITTTYLRRGQRAFFPVFSRENRRIRGDIIPAGCYRNLFATCRLKSGIPMSGERPRRSGSNAPARFGSGCGFRPEGEGEAVIRAQTGAWFFLEIGGFLQKNGNYRSKQGCTTRNGQTYAAWRLLNAQRWNPTHCPQFASSSRTGTNGAGSRRGQSDSEYTMPRKQKTLRIIDT